MSGNILETQSLQWNQSPEGWNHVLPCISRWISFFSSGQGFGDTKFNIESCPEGWKALAATDKQRDTLLELWSRIDPNELRCVLTKLAQLREGPRFFCATFESSVWVFCTLDCLCTYVASFVVGKLSSLLSAWTIRSSSHWEHTPFCCNMNLPTMIANFLTGIIGLLLQQSWLFSTVICQCGLF